MVVSCFPLQVCKSLRLHTTTTTTITTSYHSPDTCRYIFNAYFFFFSSVFGFLVATFFFLSERKKRFSVWTFVSFRHSRGRSPSDSHRREEGKKKLSFLWDLYLFYFRNVIVDHMRWRLHAAATTASFLLRFPSIEPIKFVFLLHNHVIAIIKNGSITRRSF